MIDARSALIKVDIDCEHPSAIEAYTSLAHASPFLWTPESRSSSPRLAGPSSLLSLPRELRDIIYSYVCEPDDTEFVSLVMTLFDEDDRAIRCLHPKGRSNLPGIALQRTCRQLHQECLPILYGRATFYMNPRSNYHCTHCRTTQPWSQTLASLAATPLFYAQFITKVTIWASHTEDPDSTLIDEVYGIASSVNEYQQWFWPYAMSLCQDLCRLFPRLKVAYLIPDDAKEALLTCMRQLEGYRHERIALETCTTCDQPPKYVHRVYLARVGSDGEQLHHHPALFAFQRLQECIGKAMPELGLPAVLRVLQDFWPVGPHLEQWQYHEHVFNQFLGILNQPPTTLSSTQQVEQALEDTGFAMTFACLNRNHTGLVIEKKRAEAELVDELDNDNSVSYDSSIGSEGSQSPTVKPISNCKLCETPEMARHMWWKKGFSTSWT